MVDLGGAFDKVVDGTVRGLDKGKELLGEGVDKATDKIGAGLERVGAHDWADKVEDWGDATASSLGAEVGEKQLGQSEEADELIHGKPEKITAAVKNLRDFQKAFGLVGGGLKKLDSGHWRGEAADTFRSKFQALPTDWLRAADAFEDAAKALETYASAVTSAQGKARAAIALYKEGTQDSEKAVSAFNKKVDAYNAARTSDQPLPHPGTFSDPGVSKRKRAQDDLEDARRSRNEAGERAKSAVTAAMAHAPKEPTGRDRFKDELYDHGLSQGVEIAHLGGGILKGTGGLVGFLRQTNPIDPYNLTHPAEMYKGVNMTLSGLARTAANPDRALKDAWDAAKSDPGEFVGRLLPEAVGTKGAGTLKGGLRAGLRKGAGHEGPPKPPGPAREGHEKAPDSNSKKCSQVECEGDPIDVATGRMLMPQTDITLPGSLPLIFSRVFDSSYRNGRWFGTGWSSTIDQRLEIDAEGVVFSCDQGSLLAYPHPAPGVPVMPTHGRRWPLDRAADGYTITDPDTGRILRFADRNADLALLVQIDDRNGRWITFEYDEAGAPTSIVHHGGYHLKLTTAEGRVTALHLAGAAPDGTDQEILRYGYTDGHLTTVTNSSGRPLRFDCDDLGRITAWTDTNGSRYEYVYDDLDRCVYQCGASGRLEAHFTWDGTDPESGLRMTSMTNGLGHTRRFVINARAQIVAEIDALGAITRSEYDRFGLLLSRTSPLGHVSRYEYDESGRATVTIRPDGRRSTAEYNRLGLPAKVAGTDGRVVHQTYDQRGNRVAVSRGSSTINLFTYDEAGHVVSVVDALGNTTVVRNDPAGLPVEITTPLGTTTRCERDAFGRPVVVIDALGNTTYCRWTVEGRLLSRIRPDGTEESWTYDGEGNCLTYTDAIGAVSRFEYTDFDMPLCRIGPDESRFQYAYDSNLQLTEVVNPQGLKWTYAYDSRGKLASETDFNGHTISYSYDDAGRLLTRTNNMGQTVWYEHNALGQLVRKDADGSVTTFEYDIFDELARAVGPDAELTRLRDHEGRLRSETVNGRTLTYRHDALGRNTSRTTPSGAESTWSYDAVGQRTALTSSGRTVNFFYDAAGRQTLQQLGEEVSVSRGFDMVSRITDEQVSTPERPTRFRAYTYRADGHLTDIQDSMTGPRHFDLDIVGRVTRVSGESWTETYSYDEAGNQTLASWPTSHPGREAVGERLYTGTRIDRAGHVRYEHDAVGRITMRQKPRPSRAPDTWRFTWDAEDHLTSARTPDGSHWRYLYDPLGRRIAKQRLTDGDAIAEEVQFTWDGTLLCEQVTKAADFTNPIALTWDYAGLRPLTQTERVLSPCESQDSVEDRFFAIVTDLVGAPTELVDESGATAWHTRRTLWGTTAWATGNTAYIPLRFPGQYFDPETGLHHNFYRHYDPETARYLTPDPLGLLPAPNPSTYVYNPLAWSDPLGLGPCPIGGPENHVPLDAARGDVHFPSHDDALREVMKRYEIEDPSWLERTPTWGKNPNLTGPKNEPWEVITGIDSRGREIEFHHHANGHYFKDKEQWALPHYHGPRGEHIYYGDMNSKYGMKGE
ncbi:putative T7SS-secreted protein [Streptomyces sp. NPDC012389]|uniref:putative T7SS-secreted protein n=1 Tax=unclassified Streptomyces TaxID=2593676 RepID=UPI0013705EC9|nr:DUF6531 domain-containing protein [Streptomyces sp. SID8374]MYX13416.1 type IV secretion protein Rhs [Streptomyces sp. SID8374]